MSDQHYQRMQVKVLYLFDNSSTVFLSRSKARYSVKVAQISNADNELVTLGAYDLKLCVQQIVSSSPEKFRLDTDDFAVYHQDITEQPEEPFVLNGVMSEVLAAGKQNLIPGRVCQNLSASFLFGDKAQALGLTLEIRLKLHATERAQRPKDKPERRKPAPAKATRTKLLPIFFHPPNQQISNIINADKQNVSSKYDSKSVLERFNSAPFLLAKIIEQPARKKRRQMPLTPTVPELRAMRTRSMVGALISLPIQEMDDDTDDTDDQETFQEHPAASGFSSPFTPQVAFQLLPDLEELDSKKTHIIPALRLPHNHSLVCVNGNCNQHDLMSWRYFETEFRQSYLNIPRAAKFDQSHYEGMFGPLCNACYLFLRNKGFMRPQAVVKKYLKQQKYKREQKAKPLPAAPLPKFNAPHAPSAEQRAKAPTPSKEIQDIDDFMNQLSNFGGPLTDIDLPEKNTPPMVATKSNTRVINVYDEDKENCPPDQLKDFEEMMMRSFTNENPSEEWGLFGEPTPNDTQATPRLELPQMHTFTTSPKNAANMPSSPIIDKASSPVRASRTGTTMSFTARRSSPRSEVYEDVKDV